MNLLFASANKNKIQEVSQLLPEGYTLLGLEDVGIVEEIPEPGTSIKENSFLKAEYVVKHLKKQGQVMTVFADDSGLEVEALENAPGVHSARYAGIPKSDKANNAKLLKELAGKNNRSARFVTVITLIKDENVHYFEGEVKGVIAPEPSGENGFGYDPLFIPQGYTKTFGVLGSEIKNKISHRAAALEKLKSYLKNN